MVKLGPANMRPIARRRRGQRLFAGLDFLAMNTFCFCGLGISERDAESLVLTELVASDARLVRLDGKLSTESNDRLDIPDPFLESIKRGTFKHG